MQPAPERSCVNPTDRADRVGEPRESTPAPMLRGEGWASLAITDASAPCLSHSGGSVVISHCSDCNDRNFLSSLFSFCCCRPPLPAGGWQKRLGGRGWKLWRIRRGWPPPLARPFGDWANRRPTSPSCRRRVAAGYAAADARIPSKDKFDPNLLLAQCSARSASVRWCVCATQQGSAWRSWLQWPVWSRAAAQLRGGSGRERLSSDVTKIRMS